MQFRWGNAIFPRRLRCIIDSAVNVFKCQPTQFQHHVECPIGMICNHTRIKAHINAHCVAKHVSRLAPRGTHAHKHSMRQCTHAHIVNCHLPPDASRPMLSSACGQTKERISDAMQNISASISNDTQTANMHWYMGWYNRAAAMMQCGGDARWRCEVAMRGGDAR